MKKCILKSVSLTLILCMMCFVLPSCNSMRSMPVTNSNDSVFISERQKGDTVYLTRIEWRDRWRTRIERDTVVDVRVEKEVVQLPPQRYVPKFYKWCTIFWFASLTLMVARWWLKRRV